MNPKTAALAEICDAQRKIAALIDDLPPAPWRRRLRTIVIRQSLRLFTEIDRVLQEPDPVPESSPADAKEPVILRLSNRS